MAENNLHRAERAYRFSVAPMLDCTDKHFRVLMRQISKRSLLYSEMVVAQALIRSNEKTKFLEFEELEHPISLQIAGDDPKLLAEATKLAEIWGYDEVNLNVGCPSQKVKAGNFGACLMAKPYTVAKCIEAMSKATKLPITIKHRIGIDNLDNDNLLKEFVSQVSLSGAKRFAIHARKAWLTGLNPKQNRNIPPLEYERVEALKNARPDLIIELNGGLKTPLECLKTLEVLDGAMVGRAAYEHPLRWQNIDEIIFGEKPQSLKSSDVIMGLIPYAQKNLSKGGKIWDFGRHILNLVEGFPGAKKWRKELSDIGQQKNADLKVLENAAKRLIDLDL